MKQLFTNENHLLAMNSKNVLESAGITVKLKNEYTSGSAVPGHQIYLELWVNDIDYERAIKLLKHHEIDESKTWICGKCSEENTVLFEICWKCQSEKTKD